MRRLAPGIGSTIEQLKKRKGLRKAIGRTLWGGIAVQGTLLITGVVVARALGPQDRGNFALLTLVWSISAQLAGLGIPYALTYTVARAPEAALATLRAIRRPLVIQVAVAIVGSAIALGLLTADRPSYVQWGAAVSVLAVAPALLQQCGLSVLQGLKRFVSFNVLRVLPNAVFALAATVLLLVGSKEFLLFAIAWGVSRSMWAPVTLIRARREARAVSDPNVEPPPTKRILSFGRRAMFGASPPLETYRLDQSVVALFLPPAALGYYVVSLAFTNLPRFIAQSFGMVASPMVSSSKTHRQAQRSMWKFFWLAVPFYLVVIVGLWILAPQLTDFFFGEKFHRSAEITRVLLIATALFCARRVLTDSARGAGYPGIGSIAEITAFFAAIPLLAIAVPTWGTIGVAYGLTGSSAIAFTVLTVNLLRAGRRGQTPPAWEEMRSRPADEVGETVTAPRPAEATT